MKKINLITLAYNAARAKKALIKQEEKVKELCSQLVDRVGTGGQTIKTNLGQVVVTAQTFTRPSGQMVVQFDRDAYMKLDVDTQTLLQKAGVIRLVATEIAGQAPKVQFRLV